MMTTDDVLEVFKDAGALLEGHFILSSGRRSSVFLQKALIFKNPHLTEKLCKALALSSRECIASIEKTGAIVVGGCCLFDRSGGTVDIGVPMVSLASRKFPDYDPSDLPESLKNIPAIKPGSRGLS